MLLYPGAERRRIPNGPQTRWGNPSHFRPVDRQGAGQDSSDLLNVSPGHSTPTHSQATVDKTPSPSSSGLSLDEMNSTGPSKSSQFSTHFLRAYYIHKEAIAQFPKTLRLQMVLIIENPMNQNTLFLNLCE